MHLWALHCKPLKGKPLSAVVCTHADNIYRTSPQDVYLRLADLGGDLSSSAWSPTQDVDGIESEHMAANAWRSLRAARGCDMKTFCQRFRVLPEISEVRRLGSLMVSDR